MDSSVVTRTFKSGGAGTGQLGGFEYHGESRDGSWSNQGIVSRVNDGEICGIGSCNGERHFGERGGSRVSEREEDRKSVV